jgi:hypothetical protein
MHLYQRLEKAKVEVNKRVFTKTAELSRSVPMRGRLFIGD